MIPSSPRTAGAEPTEKKEEAPSYQLSAQTFATNFTREYLQWTKGKEDSRKERLEPYLHPDLDAQAGLDMSQVEWDSWAREVEVWSLQPLGKGKWEAFAYAQLQMSQGKKQKRVDRWMKIPMEEAGESFRVTAPPYFVAQPKADPPKEEESEEKKGDAVDSAVQEDVETFLNSFWKTYTTGKPEEIRYLMKGEGETEGLTGILSFVEMRDLKVYQEGESYRAESMVLFQDLASGAEVTYPYTLYLEREGTRWYVMNIEQNERH
ncbi:Conjugative transposon protein TcpC [Mycobacterium tuberculosis]|nr:Conjugative transposon protein TcpC [Mycobacterium tuberculosis]